MTRKWRVLGRTGSGSAIVEAALVLAGIAYDREEVDAEGQTVILPDGTLMTESAALILYIDGLVPELGLVPNVREPQRRELMRWLMFLVAAVHPTFAPTFAPTFTHGDGPASTEEHRKSLWRLVEGSVRGPWFLGERPSALDLYISVMTRWRPGRAWFAESCPRLHAVAVEVDRDPRLLGVWKSNFA
jgi:GST-like protein